VIPLDDHRTGDLAVSRPLPGGADVDQRGARAKFSERVTRRHPAQPGPRRREDVIDRTRAVRP
jgi:hypothetical protein